MDVSDESATSLQALDLNDQTFDLEYGTLAKDFTLFDELEIIDNTEYGFPDEFTEIEILDSESSTLEIKSWEYDGTLSVATIECEIRMTMENGKELTGNYIGEIRVFEE